MYKVIVSLRETTPDDVCFAKKESVVDDDDVLDVVYVA